VAKSRGLGGKVQRVGWQSQEDAWLVKSIGMVRICGLFLDGYGKYLDEWQSPEDWVAKSRAMGAW
jgi:hypothetical protein